MKFDEKNGETEAKIALAGDNFMSGIDRMIEEDNRKNGKENKELFAKHDKKSLKSMQLPEKEYPKLESLDEKLDYLSEQKKKLPSVLDQAIFEKTEYEIVADNDNGMEHIGPGCDVSAKRDIEFNERMEEKYKPHAFENQGIYDEENAEIDRADSDFPDQEGGENKDAQRKLDYDKETECKETDSSATETESDSQENASSGSGSGSGSDSEGSGGSGGTTKKADKKDKKVALPGQSPVGDSNMDDAEMATGQQQSSPEQKISPGKKQVVDSIETDSEESEEHSNSQSKSASSSIGESASSSASKSVSSKSKNPSPDKNKSSSLKKVTSKRKSTSPSKKRKSSSAKKSASPNADDAGAGAEGAVSDNEEESHSAPSSRSASSPEKSQATNSDQGSAGDGSVDSDSDYVILDNIFAHETDSEQEEENKKKEKQRVQEENKQLEKITRFFYNWTHFFDFLARFKGFFDFFSFFESDYKNIVLNNSCHTYVPVHVPLPQCNLAQTIERRKKCRKIAGKVRDRKFFIIQKKTTC